MRRSLSVLPFLFCGLLAQDIAAAAGNPSSLPSSSPVPAGEQPFNFRFDGMTGNLTYSDSVPSVKDFLGYATGEHFTRHSDTVAYA